MEERLQRGIYKGMGEFHLSAAHVEAPVVQRFAALAAQRQLVPGGMQDIRAWLGQLPREVAEQRAWRNAERLFGVP